MTFQMPLPRHKRANSSASTSAAAVPPASRLMSTAVSLPARARTNLIDCCASFVGSEFYRIFFRDWHCGHLSEWDVSASSAEARAAGPDLLFDDGLWLPENCRAEGFARAQYMSPPVV